MDVAVAVRLCLDGERIVFLQRQVRVPVCEARHLHPNVYSMALR